MPFAFSVSAQGRRILSLQATGEGPLTFTITDLPANGKLYQTADGTTAGAEITTAGTAITHPAGLVLFHPAANVHGQDEFTFTAANPAGASAAAVSVFLDNDGLANLVGNFAEAEVTLPDELDLSKALVRFTYSADDPSTTTGSDLPSIDNQPGADSVSRRTSATIAFAVDRRCVAGSGIARTDQRWARQSDTHVDRRG